jgi:hypothetical protein
MARRIADLPIAIETDVWRMESSAGWSRVVAIFDA